MTTPHGYPDHDHAAHGPTSAPGSLRCPECGEPARTMPPRDWPLDGFASRPATSHHDGTPLCPVPGPNGSQPADPVGAPARLTMRQAVRQSWLIHPDWTVADHLAWLDGEGYDTGTLTGDPDEVVGRWLTEHRRSAPVPRPADDPRVYMVAGGRHGGRVRLGARGRHHGPDDDRREPRTGHPALTEAQWEQAHAVLRSQQPHITVTDARPRRAAGAS